MRKAFIDQMFFGFLLLMTVAFFVATINDETLIRNEMEDLQSLARTSSHSISEYYALQMDMCTAQEINNNILRESKLGKYLLDNGLISYTWLDTTGDAQPDTVKTTIGAYAYETFWYKFLDKDSFTIGPFSAEEGLTTPLNVNLTFGGENAGYTNMVGTYTLDDNGCVQNPQIILENSKRPNEGDSVGSQFTTPPTYTFIISDGYNTFKNGNNDYPSLNDTITMNHCISDVTDDTSNPTVTLNNKTVDNAHIYFEHNSLNGDGNYSHFQIIPKSIWDTYNDFISNLSGDANDKYQQFIEYADNLNKDIDPSNDIDYKTDPNNEYRYSMEDLNGGGDQDFNDLVLDSTRIAIPNNLNDFSVGDHGIILLNCGNNQNPIVTITGCPITINEDTVTSDIGWEATDVDGSIYETTASTENGTVVINDNGTLTYTPKLNYFGTDKITFRATDNSGGVGFGYCSITISEINDAPIIYGSPASSININNYYSFIPTASDPDNDIITFSISNKPSWLTFVQDSGELIGTPSENDLGLYENIVISVTDGQLSASLPAFSIEVTDNNSKPTSSEIPDGTVKEDTYYSFDVSPYFTDADGDNLTYSITVYLNGTNNVSSYFSINQNGLITSNTKIPNGYVGSTLTINVTVSDGKESTTSSYNVKIINEVDLQIFNLTFDRDEEGFDTTYGSWIRDSYDSNEGKLKIQARRTKRWQTTGRFFNFGPSFANKDVTVSFDLNFVGGWENWGSSQDYFTVYLNHDLLVDRESFGNYYGSINYGSKSYSLEGRTDSDGILGVSLSIYVSSTNEVLYIDNFIVELQ
ncbi:Ig-like domain-containing protein [Halarcobacter sp.]|uniref:Ig-like domain-containing protein n=1 Tax=Halarcobacter sp. TaxID=2321133 RepID=UPI002AAAB98D|nr:Ig-like domain-containing protein [Halarcobacter sp.]